MSLQNLCKNLFSLAKKLFFEPVIENRNVILAILLLARLTL